MNSEGGSKGLLVFLSTACAVRVYWALSSRSSVFVAWMFPDLSSITKMIPAPSPERMYLMFPSPESISEWSYKTRNRHSLTRWYMVHVCVYETKKKSWNYYHFTVFKNLVLHQAIIHTRAHAVNTSAPAFGEAACTDLHATTRRVLLRPKLKDLRKRIHEKTVITDSSFKWSWKEESFSQRFSTLFTNHILLGCM